MRFREWIFVGSMITALAVVVVMFNLMNSKPEMQARVEKRMQMIAEKMIKDDFQQRFFEVESADPMKAQANSRVLASVGSAKVPGTPNVIEVLKRNLVGEVGRDPWGRPFHFKVTGNGKKGDQLFIFGAGPDGVFQTNEATGEASGDDILFKTEINS